MGTEVRRASNPLSVTEPCWHLSLSRSLLSQLSHPQHAAAFARGMHPFDRKKLAQPSNSLHPALSCPAHSRPVLPRVSANLPSSRRRSSPARPCLVPHPNLPAAVQPAADDSAAPFDPVLTRYIATPTICLFPRGRGRS